VKIEDLEGRERQQVDAIAEIKEILRAGNFSNIECMGILEAVKYLVNQNVSKEAKRLEKEARERNERA